MLYWKILPFIMVTNSFMLKHHCIREITLACLCWIVLLMLLDMATSVSLRVVCTCCVQNKDVSLEVSPFVPFWFGCLLWMDHAVLHHDMAIAFLNQVSYDYQWEETFFQWRRGRVIQPLLQPASHPKLPVIGPAACGLWILERIGGGGWTEWGTPSMQLSVGYHLCKGETFW